MYAQVVRQEVAATKLKAPMAVLSGAIHQGDSSDTEQAF